MARLQVITLEELLEMQVNDDEFTWVEALPRKAFDEGHIPGAVNIPMEHVAENAEKHLDNEDTVVVYCQNYACKASGVVAGKLLKLGYEDTVDFAAGKDGWTDAGFELETG